MGQINEKTNQHIIPKFYLKGFCKDNSLIYSYTKNYNYKKNPQYISINKQGIFTRSDYYTKYTPDGKRNLEIENDLSSSFENGMPQLIQEIYQDLDCLSDKDRCDKLVKFVASMILRTDARRKEIIRHNKKIKDNPAILTPYLEDPSVKRHIDVLKTLGVSKNDFLNYYHNNKVNIPVNDQHINFFFNQLDKWIEHIKAMNWYFFKAPTKRNFITSDNPVYLPCHPTEKDFYNKGIGIPLRKDLFFAIVNKGNRIFPRHRNSPKDIRFINSCTAITSYKYLFSHNDKLLLRVARDAGI